MMGRLLAAALLAVSLPCWVRAQEPEPPLFVIFVFKVAEAYDVTYGRLVQYTDSRDRRLIVQKAEALGFRTTDEWSKHPHHLTFYQTSFSCKDVQTPGQTAQVRCRSVVGLAEYKDAKLGRYWEADAEASGPDDTQAMVSTLLVGLERVTSDYRAASRRRPPPLGELSSVRDALDLLNAGQE